MTQKKFNIIPYDSSYEDQLMELEKEAIQGNLIQLKMNRSDFQSRSRVFDDYKIFICISDKNEVIGVAAGSIVPIILGEQTRKIGIGYDLRVKKDHRRQGLARAFGNHLIEAYFNPEGIHHSGTTSKKDNVAVYKAALGLDHSWNDSPFIYLSIPIEASFKRFKYFSGNSIFSTELLSMHEGLKGYYQVSESGIGIFNTYKMYRLTIHKIHSMMRLGIGVRNLLKRTPITIPPVGEEMRMVTSFGLDNQNISDFPDVIRGLQEEGIHYCNVVCSRNDFIYKTLKPYSVNEYQYLFIHNMGSITESIKFDVRCL